jgi:hypothetical protein
MGSEGFRHSAAGGSAQPLAAETASLIQQETPALRNLSKSEYRIMNIECRMIVFYSK